MSTTPTTGNSIISTIVAKTMAVLKKEEDFRGYRPTYKSKHFLSRLRADIVGLNASLRYEKFREKKGGKQQAMHQLIKNSLKEVARAKLIAYSLLRGKSYKQAENTVRTLVWWHSYECIRLIKAISAECVQQAVDSRERQWFGNTENIKTLMMMGETENVVHGQ